MITFRRVLVLALAILVGGCETDSQRPSDTFADNKFPAPLERLANQKHQLANAGGIVQRVRGDLANPNVVPIAVIDNGVDLAHPDLVGKILFDIDGNKIVGAGRDFMGEDNFASPNLVDPTLYAFGAKAIKEGMIDGPPARPLDGMAKFNADFMNRLVAKIAADPVLSASLFRKVTPKSMSVFGAHNAVALKYFDADDYEQAKRNGELISTTTKPEDLEKRASIVKVIFRYVSRDEWAMDSDSNLPEIGPGKIYSRKLVGLEHADKFFALLKSELEAWGKESGYDNAFATFKSFIEPRYTKANSSRDDLNEVMFGTLCPAMFVKLFGPRVEDPLRALITNLDVARYSSGQWFVPQADEKVTARRQDVLSLALKRFERLVSYSSKLQDLSAEEADRVTLMNEQLGSLRAAVEWFAQARSLETSLDAPLSAMLPEATAYRAWLVRTQHPFVAKQNNEATHASHVSGIISAQNENLRIVPVRVTTEGMNISPQKRAKLLEGLRAKLGDFFADPVVLRALGSVFEGLPGVDFKAATPEARLEAAKNLLKILDPQLRRAVDDNGLEISFMEDVEGAIRYVGERQIKIANVSLGISDQDEPKTARATDPRKKLIEAFGFIRFELNKYRLGLTIKRHASKTLFVVATGNDGKWVDGETRSALPVDLSSPFLERFETETETVANNHIDNILAVGSLNPNLRLSSFTNILIGSRTPFVLAEGESVLSPVRVLDPSGVNQLLETEFAFFDVRNFDKFSSLGEARLMPLVEDEIRALGVTDAKKVAEMKEDWMSGMIYDSNVLQETMKAMKSHLFIKKPNHRARLSGTSMATPTTVGLIGDLVQKKASAMGLFARTDLYEHPEFTPAKLIDAILAKAEPYNGSGRGVQLKKLIGDRKWGQDKGGEELETFLEELRSKGHAPARATKVRAKIVR